MNEEEKKAIDEFNKLLADFKGLSKLSLWYEIDAERQNELYNTLYPLSNLIEKQQKEIEKLKEQNTQLSNYLNDSYYVSADKIREKIKKCKENEKYFAFIDNKSYARDFNKDLIKAYEELLEEN